MFYYFITQRLPLLRCLDVRWIMFFSMGSTGGAGWFKVEFSCVLGLNYFMVARKPV